METLPDGSLRFVAKGESFLFTKQNYDTHCLKREVLKYDWFLKSIEDALSDPDVTTQIKSELIKNSADKRKKTYYKVTKQITSQYLRITQVPTTIAKPDSFIHTAIDFYAAPWTVINTKVEIITWQKPNCLII
jgi:hypothetical protein